MKISTPPSKLLSRLNVPAPRHIAKKKSFRSAPRMVRGRESERCTRLIRLAFAISAPVSPDSEGHASRKEPSHEVDGGDSHAHAEENAGEDAFRAAFAEGEGESGDDNRDEGQPARDGAGECLLENANGVFPGRSTGRLSEDRCREEQRDGDGQ